MDHGWARRTWYESQVPVFLEKIVLPALAATLGILLWTNPMNFDWQQRVSLGIAALALSYWVAHSLHLRNESLRADKQPVQFTTVATPKQEHSGERKGQPEEQPILKQPTLREEVKDVQILAGENVIGIPIAQLGKPVNPFEQVGVKVPFVRLYVRDGVVCVDTSFSIPGRSGTFSLTCNQFSMSVIGLDLNSNDKAIEIVDESETPVFQLVFVSPSRISIRGVFTDGIGFLALTDSVLLAGQGTKPPQPLPALKRIFKYPAWKYPGQYAE